MALLEISNLSREFGLGKSVVKALDDVSLRLEAGEILGVVGESGSGKSTLARIVMALDLPTSGKVFLDGQDLFALSPRELRRARRDFQMVFQDPYGSLHPRQTVDRALSEPLEVHGIPDHEPRILRALAEVALPPAVRFRYPHQLSGGQRQRVNIARNLAVEAEVVLADEPTSMLDVSIRIGILNLMEQMKNELGVSMLYITHDIATARYVAEDLAVMYVGHMVEWGEVDEILHHPQHPYTQLLISAVPDPEKSIHAELEGGRKGEIPLWTPESRGCPFAGRCHQAMGRLDQCKSLLYPRNDGVEYQGDGPADEGGGRGGGKAARLGLGLGSDG